MPKTAKILIAIVILIVLIVAGIKVKDYFEKQAFLDKLKGEIVYANNGDIYITSIEEYNNKERLYSSSDEETISKLKYSSYEGEEKIFFVKKRLVKGKDWEWKNIGTFIIDTEGNNFKKISSKIINSFLEEKNKDSHPVIEECGRELSWKDKQGKIHIIYEAKVKPSLKRSARISSCRWSPDKKYIVFVEDGSGEIKIVDKEGENVVTIGEGTNPDWVY